MCARTVVRPRPHRGALRGVQARGNVPRTPRAWLLLDFKSYSVPLIFSEFALNSHFTVPLSRLRRASLSADPRKKGCQSCCTSKCEKSSTNRNIVSSPSDRFLKSELHNSVISSYRQNPGNPLEIQNDSAHRKGDNIVAPEFSKKKEERRDTRRGGLSPRASQGRREARADITCPRGNTLRSAAETRSEPQQQIYSESFARWPLSFTFLETVMQQPGNLLAM